MVSDSWKRDSLWLRGNLLGLVCVLIPLFQPALPVGPPELLSTTVTPVALVDQRVG